LREHAEFTSVRQVPAQRPERNRVSKVFDPFQRGEEDAVKREGLGLGL
jgi:hypothetical protein